jgi:hypothetical protein
VQVFAGRDSSLFLYVAQRIQDGALPYRDVWDHKPPLIFYFGVIGLALADHGLPGVVGVEFAALLVAASVGFFALQRALGVLPAIFGTVAWTITIPLMLNGGNRPEEYAWPFQFGAIALYLAERRAPSRWRWVAIGVLAGFAALLKPTILGVWLAIYLAELVRARQIRSLSTFARPLLLGTLGGLAPTILASAYFIANGAFNDLVDQVIRFNVEYSRSSLSGFLDALAHGVKLTAVSGLLPIALAGWAMALVQLTRGSAPELARPLFTIAVLALPIDFALASATGRPYSEYFLACLPTLGILAAVAISSLRPALERAASRLSMRPLPFAASIVILGTLVLASAIPALVEYRQKQGPTDQERTRSQATAYVVGHTAPTDRVLFWGGEGGLNYTTGRRSPTRYAYQFALYMRHYQRPDQIDELLSALKHDPPALIVDASPATTDAAPLDRAERARWTLLEPKYMLLPEMDRLFAWIEEHYVRAGEVGALRWPIYQPRDGARR